MTEDRLPEPPWAAPSRRRRQVRPEVPLERATIVREALTLADAEGLDAVTVRALATRLGVTPMALYWHVRDKAELLDLMGGEMLAEVRLPEPSDAWQDDLRAIFRETRRMLRAHPGAASLAFGRARYSPAGIGMMERVLATLARAGFADDEAGLAYMALYTFLRGNWSSESGARAAGEEMGQARDYLASLPPDLYPRTATIGPALFRRDPEVFFSDGLEVVLAGLTLRLADRSVTRD